MIGQEHYEQATQHLEAARAASQPVPIANHLAAAQVHATLALYLAWADPADSSGETVDLHGQEQLNPGGQA